MFIDRIVEKSKELFPKLSFKFKDQSFLMQMLGKLLFFNKEFNTNYTTTLGHCIYFPSEKYLKSHPITSTVIIAHELVHVYDRERLGLVLFSFLYLFPQILVLLILPAWFLLGWIGLFCLLFLLPIPSITRAYLELRGYAISLYSMHRLNQNGHSINLEEHSLFYQNVFLNSSYYYMLPNTWIIKKIFYRILDEINNNRFPLKDAKLQEKIDYLLQS